MLLSREDFDHFARLYDFLAYFLNQRLEIVSNFPDPETFRSLPLEEQINVRDELTKNIGLIDDFVAENPANLAADDLSIVSQWKHCVAGKFIVFRQLKKHMIFLTAENSPTAYGVLALTETFGELFGSKSLPRLVRTVLLPFKGKLVYDGLVNTYGVSYGGGIKRSLNDTYRDAKERLGVVTSLPMKAANDRVKKKRKPQPAKPKQKASGANDTEHVVGLFIKATDAFCDEMLNEEYAELCRKMVKKLSRKRPFPFLRGRPKTWICGIIRTIGTINFLQDSSFEPYMKSSDIDKVFGVSSSTGQKRSKQIRDLLKIHELDPEWTVPSLLEQNPMVWMLEVNGFMMDARTAPREIQQTAFEKGLIPYIPADSESSKPSKNLEPSKTPDNWLF